MQRVIYRCAELHVNHIATSGDPFEFGSARPLDFGHWSAHKLEQLTDHRLGHGEAVAIGIALDTTYSYLAGFLPEDDWRRIISLMPALGLPVYVPELGQQLGDGAGPDRGAAGRRSVLDGLDEFREHLGGALTILMLRSIGAPFDVHDIRRDVMIRSIGVLRDFEHAHRLREERHDRHIRPEPAEPQGTG
jgi:3-dehydroquinate synthase